MTKVLLAVLDTETTGIDAHNEQILSLAVRLVHYTPDNQTLVEKDTFFRNIRLSEDIIPDKEALGINGINPFTQDWENNPCEKQVAEELCDWLAAAGEKVYFCAYNAKFDYNFIFKLFDVSDKDMSLYFERHIVDPMLVSKELIKDKKLVTELNNYGKPSAALGAVAKGLGLTLNKDNLHGAIYDTEVLLNVMRAFLKDNANFSKMFETTPNTSKLRLGVKRSIFNEKFFVNEEVVVEDIIEFIKDSGLDKLSAQSELWKINRVRCATGLPSIERLVKDRTRIKFKRLGDITVFFNPKGKYIVKVKEHAFETSVKTEIVAKVEKLLKIQLSAETAKFISDLPSIASFEDKKIGELLKL